MAPRSEESRNKQLRALARENLQGLQQRKTLSKVTIHTSKIRGERFLRLRALVTNSVTPNLQERRSSRSEQRPL